MNWAGRGPGIIVENDACHLPALAHSSCIPDEEPRPCSPNCSNSFVHM